MTDYEKIELSWELLKKVRENGYNCLCKLNTRCPCDEFIDEKKCVCGLYKFRKK